MEEGSSSEEEFIAPKAKSKRHGGVGWRTQAFAEPLTLQRSSAPVPVDAAAVDREPIGGPSKGWSGPSSPLPSPRAKTAFHVGGKRSVQPSFDAMRDEIRSPLTGVEVRDEKHKLRTFTQCFPALEAVSWLVKRYAMTRAEGVVFCQQLFDDGWLKCASSAATVFVDAADVFYQWVTIDPTPSSPPKRSPLSVRGLRSRVSSPSVLLGSRPMSGVNSTNTMGSAEKTTNSGLDLFNALPSIQPRKRSVHFLSLGKGISREILMTVPRFIATGADNPLLSAKELQKLDHLKCVSIRGLGLSNNVFLLCMGSTLKKLRHLEQLDVSENDLGIPTALQLLSNWGASNLRELRLCKTGLQSDCIEEDQFWSTVFGHVGTVKLRLLDISCNLLGDSSMPMLAKYLSLNNSLNSLLLDDNCLSPVAQQLLVLSLVRNITVKYRK